MELVYGDMWKMKADAKCITTCGTLADNGWLIMGAGTALQAREKFPKLQEVLGSLVAEHGNRVFPLDTSGIVAPGYVLVSFPTKHQYFKQGDYHLIKKSCEELKELIEIRKWTNVILPAPGCGYGELSWRYVEPILQKTLGDLPVTVVSK